MLIYEKISSAIWRQNEFSNEALDARLAGLTAYHITRTMGIRYAQIYHSGSVENILFACQTDWCLIQSPGHIYGSRSVVAARNILLGMAEQDNVAAFGHLLDDKKYFGLHHQVMLINVKLWRENGRPAFGPASVGEQVVHPIQRSEENVHDDYTPLWLGPEAGSAVKVDPKTVGWNFISHLAGLGYKFENFSRPFRNLKFFCYPQKRNADSMLDALRDVSQDTALEDERLISIVKRVRASRPSGIHIINNEGNQDIPKRNTETVGTGIFVSSGFKSNVILHRLGFTQETQIIFYDIDDATIEFKRRLISGWDGRNFLTHASGLVKSMSEEYKTGIFRDVDLNTSYESMINDVFESEENWISHWLKFRKLNFSFVKADILRGQEPLIKAIQERCREGRQVIWTSNIFNYGIEVIGMSYDERRKAYSTLVDRVRDVTGRGPDFVGQMPKDFADGKWV